MSDWLRSLPEPVLRAVRVRLARLDADGFVARLLRRDDTLWGTDGRRHEVASRRLGWIAIAEQMRPQTASLRAFAQAAAAEGFTRALLLGMGGSSLAPEVLARTFGAAPGALGLEVLDDTSPAAVQAALSRHDPARTLVVVSSKSGTTLEVISFERAVHEWLAAARPDPGRAMVAITDHGTPFASLARDREYRRVFLNPPDIGGRFSALSCFGMVPAALLGVDVDRLLDAALAEFATLHPDAPAEASPAVALGASLGELALAGRDKLTLLPSPPLESLGDWIEQLVAESTGKEGRGIVPIVGEPARDPDRYGADRVFVSVTVGAPGAGLAQTLGRLREAGHPVLHWSRETPLQLGAEFLRWEIATVVAAAVLDVNPFDEPNVAEAKRATQELLQRRGSKGGWPRSKPVAAADGIAIAAPAGVARRLRWRITDPRDPAQWLAETASLARPGDYLAVLAFLHRTRAIESRLEALRDVLGAASGVATTLGFGPRYLHSTGQLHKGGPDSGVFLLLHADQGQWPIPGQDYGFGELHRAQALADYHVLHRRRRRVVQADLGSDPEAALDRLCESLAAAQRA